jgi:hypothetical protein
MDGPWTLAELTALAVSALTDGRSPRPGGRVRDLPNERTIRWYVTIGLVDPPLSRRGRVAVYGPRHLLQLVAVKRRQAEGRSLAEIQAELTGATDATLRRIARLDILDAVPASSGEATGEPGESLPARETGEAGDVLPGWRSGESLPTRKPGEGPLARKVGQGPLGREPGEGGRAPGSGAIPSASEPGTLPPALEPGAFPSGSEPGAVLPARDADGGRAVPGARRFWAERPASPSEHPASPPEHPAFQPERPVSPLRRPAAGSAPGMPRTGEDDLLVRGVRLAPGVTLLLDSPPSSDDAAAIMAAAAPLLDLLTERGLL